MGIIRGGLFFVASFLLLLSLLAVNIFLVITLSMNYDNVQREFSGSIKEILWEEIDLDNVLQETYPAMQEYCQENLDYVFSESGYTFIVSCSAVNQGFKEVVNNGLNNFMRDIYFREYHCNFWDCFRKGEIPFFLVSEKARDYWRSNFYLAIVASLILASVTFLLIKDKSNFPIFVGILIAISSLPLLVLDLIKFNWVPSFFPEKYLFKFFTIFFSESQMVFLISFILGAVMLGLGILLKFFWVGFKISNFFSKKDKKVSKKEVKELVEKEISKKKQQKSK